MAVYTSGYLSYVVYKTKFQLQARSHSHVLSGILCEKGKVLTDIRGFTYSSLQGAPTGLYTDTLLVIKGIHLSHTDIVSLTSS